ncbi:MAG: hypothetical protein K5641_03925 [Lachnospiraceae bacterium]|nr:hypothetical protein [Lachnospiraceae bacterium]
MALGEENGRPVKYDGYNVNVYLQNDGNTQKATDVCREELTRRLDNLTDSPMHLSAFMAKKNSLVWNEPTFESVSYLNKNASYAESPKWLKDALWEDNRNLLYRFANLFHGLILLGALTWIVLKGKEASPAHLLYGVTFIGGFLFELFWEAQAQYALVYFLLLIPYGVMGYVEAVNYLSAKPPVKKAAIGWGIPLLIIVIVSAVHIPIVDTLIRLQEDDAVYTQIRTEQEEEELIFEGTLPDGMYRMASAVDPTLGITVSAEYDKDDAINQEARVYLSKEAHVRAGEVSVVHEGDHDLIRLMRTQCLLSLDRDPNEPGAVVSQAYDEALWHIKSAGDGKYAVLYGNELALTAEGTDVTLTPYSEDKAQLWIFEKR